MLNMISFTVLNMSTSAQLTFSMPADFTPASVPDALSPIAYFPYFHNSYLAVAAALNGGNVLATFVGMLTSWMKEFGNHIFNSTFIYPDMPCSILDKPVLNGLQEYSTVFVIKSLRSYQMQHRIFYLFNYLIN